MGILNPLVSVVLPVYNAQHTVSEAIESILQQTFTDFEFIIINDGSTDESEKIILSYNDERIKYYSNEGNKGLIYTLNRGLKLSSGKYILRMDADDISRSYRLEKQVAYMEKHPNIIASGSAYEKFGIVTGIYCPPTKDIDIKKTLLFGSPIPHPTAIIRNDILNLYKINYNVSFVHAEDYKLWYDLSKIGRLSNVDDVLLYYRISQNQISTKYNQIQLENSKKIRRQIIKDILYDYNLSPLECYNLKSINNFYRKAISLNLFENDIRISYIIFSYYMSLKTYSISSFISILKHSELLTKGLEFKYYGAILIKHFKMVKIQLNRYSLL